VRRALLACLLCALAWPAAASADGVFRTATYDKGTWTYTNGLEQARGANTDGLHREDYFKAVAVPGDPTNDSRDLSYALTYGFFGAYRANHNGDYELPRDPARWPDGTGEVAELSLSLDGDVLVVRWLWNAMPRPDAQIATLTFGDGPAREWPHGARLSSPYAVALTTWGTGATLGDRRVAVSTGDHFTEARVPLSALPDGPWVLRGGSGLADPDDPSRYWEVPAGNASATAPGSGGPASPTNIWGLLFAGDKPWTFDERHQADVLATGEVSGNSVVVDPVVLRARATRGVEPSGDFSRLFTSRLAGPDGIEKTAGLIRPQAPPEGVSLPPRETGFDQSWNYTGRLQWYGMHVPQRYVGSKDKWPLIVYLHGYGCTADEAFFLPVGLIAEADKRGYLVATPHGRGDRFYRGDGDLDVQEVLRDVKRRYRVDPDRVYLMGHSMGGYGTNNVATRHPDQFAAVAPFEGTDSIPLSRNLLHVPWLAVGAVEDLDANAEQARAMYGALSEAGQDATLLVYDLKIHEYSSIYDTLPRLFDFFAAHERDRDPSVVSWTRPLASDDAPKLGLVYDGAYWVDGVRAADEKALASVVAESLAIPHVRRDPARAARTSEPREDPGPSGRTRGTLYATVPDKGSPAPRGNALRVLASNAAALTVDLRRARLKVTRRRPLIVRVDSKSPLTLTLRHTRVRRARVRIDRGRRGHGSLQRSVRARKGVLTVKLPTGTHTVGLRRVR
jgi:predicted esterase